MPTVKVCYWPCGTWCYDEDLLEHLEFMSDDYATLDTPAILTDEEVDFAVSKLISGAWPAKA